MAARRRLFAVLTLAAGALVMPRAIAAEPKPLASAPLEISADKLDLDLEAKSATMTGRVKIVKGALELRCPRVDVRYGEAPQVSWVKGTGGVVVEMRSAGGDAARAWSGVRAEAPEVELDVASQVLSLRGGVRVTRGEGWISADKATVNLASGKLSMTDVRGSLPVPSASASAKP